MVKSIPIFEFAFAAYAATAQGSVELPQEAPPERRLFETTWRSMESRDGALLVKIGVLDEGGGVAMNASPFASALPVREIWLGRIEETAGGYSGVLCMTQTPLRSVPLGRRIHFGPTHILDWTISYDTHGACEGSLKSSQRTAREPCADCERFEEALG